MTTRLHRALAAQKSIRVIGFDDAPFDKESDDPVHFSGVICSDAVFEGMIWGEVTRDGFDATDRVISLLQSSKFLPQLHLTIFDGIAFGGFNVIDIARVSQEIGLPAVSVMRNRPDFPRIDAALAHLERGDEKRATMREAGDVHEYDTGFFQVVGESPETIRAALKRITTNGHLPEPIRMAHLIGSAVKTGQSGRRA